MAETPKFRLDGVIDGVDLKGSMLGSMLESTLNPEEVFVAPAIGANFVEGWKVP